MTFITWVLAFFAATAVVMLALHLNKGAVPHAEADDHGHGGGHDDGHSHGGGHH